MSDNIRRPATLITGANGEMGHGLIDQLAREGKHTIIGLDVRPLDDTIARQCSATIVGDILEPRLLERLQSEHHDEDARASEQNDQAARDGPLGGDRGRSHATRHPIFPCTPPTPARRGFLCGGTRTRSPRSRTSRTHESPWLHLSLSG